MSFRSHCMNLEISKFTSKYMLIALTLDLSGKVLFLCPTPDYFARLTAQFLLGVYIVISSIHLALLHA